MLFKKKYKRFIFKHILDDNKQITRMKKMSLNPVYSCSGEMYKLLSYEVMHKLVKKIKKCKICLSNDLIYGRDVISSEEKFLYNLNKYIGYVKNNYFMEHEEQLYLIELSLSNKYSDVLFSLLEYNTEESCNYYDDQFRKMFLYNFYNNIFLFEKYSNEYSAIKKFVNMFKDYNFDSEEDVKKVEVIFKEINTKRRKWLFNIFLPSNEFDDKYLEFYFYQLEDLLEQYFK